MDKHTQLAERLVQELIDTDEDEWCDYHEGLLETIKCFDASLLIPYYESRKNRD
jgi:hypothetical protein